MATSFGEAVHPDEWRKRTAGLLLPVAEEEGKEEEEEGGGEDQKPVPAAASAAGPSAGDASGARTHLIAGFSVEAALCPGQLSTAARGVEEGEEENGEEGGAAAAEEEAKEGEGEEGGGQQPRKKKRRKETTTVLRSRINRDPFCYDGAARALLEAGGSL